MTIRATDDVVPAGRTRTGSPGRIVPLTMRPEKPRKSRLGRLTHCTGRRKGRVAVSSSTWTVSRKPSSVGPWYQCMCELGATTLSPLSADTGMNVTSVRPMLSANVAVLASIWSNTAGDQSTRSILLTATTTRLMPSSETRNAVPAGLGEHALAGVDEDHGDIRGRRAGDHVARVLLVAGGVGDDELAALGGEVAVGDVDRDALLTFGRQPVEQQGEIQVAALGSDPGRIGGEGGEVVLEHEVRLVEQAADQRALAVVDAAAGDEPQQALVLLGDEVGVDVGGDELGRVGHQK